MKLIVLLLCLPAIAMARPKVHKSFKSYVNKQLLKSLQLQKKAKNYVDWEHNYYKPNKTIKRVLIKSNSKKENTIICNKILSLKDSEKIYFLNAVKDSKYSNKLNCKQKFITETIELLNNIAIQLQKNTTTQPIQLNVLLNETTENSRKLFLKKSDQPLGPSQEIKISTKGGPIFYDGGLPDKTILFTFDDGPHKTNTMQLLEILHAHNLRANFFTVGKNIAKLPSVIKALSARGHFVGNHSWNHKQMSKQRFTTAQKEIEITFHQLNETIDNWVPFFRFPYGDRTDQLTKYLKFSNYGIFYWNIDTLDWKYSDPKALLKYALQQINSKQKGIVLFHDIQLQTIAIMPALLNELKVQGYKTVVVNVQ